MYFIYIYMYTLSTNFEGLEMRIILKKRIFQDNTVWINLQKFIQCKSINFRNIDSFTKMFKVYQHFWH